MEKGKKKRSFLVSPRRKRKVPGKTPGPVKNYLSNGGDV